MDSRVSFPGGRYLCACRSLQGAKITGFCLGLCKHLWIVMAQLQTTSGLNSDAVIGFHSKKTPRRVLLRLRLLRRRGKEKDPGWSRGRKHWKSRLAWVSHEAQPYHDWGLRKLIISGCFNCPLQWHIWRLVRAGRGEGTNSGVCCTGDHENE